MSGERFAAVFPSFDAVPEQHRLARLDQKEYLSDGDIKLWHGPSQEVLSPVCVKKDGALSRVPIGSFPLLSESEAMNVLEAAVEAYAKGKGEWPTMSVENRIKCVIKFVQTMKTKRT